MKAQSQTVEQLLRHGKSLDLVTQWEEAHEVLGRLPAELRSELVKAYLQQVLEGSMLQGYGPEKWRLCGTGASSEEPALEPAVVPDGK